MAEISRSEAIYCMNVAIDRKVCEECNIYGSTGTDHCYEDACIKAISDMEKLEKIEQELNYDCRTDESINCLECKPKYDRGCNSCLETRRLEKIEQILRGENE